MAHQLSCRSISFGHCAKRKLPVKLCPPVSCKQSHLPRLNRCNQLLLKRQLASSAAAAVNMSSSKHVDLAPATAAGTTNEEGTAAENGSRAITRQHSSKPPGTRKLLVILHGKRIDDDQIREAITTLKKEGHQVQVRVTFDSGDVDQFVKEALELWDQQEYDTLVAGGGDGTLNELVAALLKHGGRDSSPKINIAQLPLGTANDLASATGISLAPLDALRLALDPSTVHPIDVALVNGEVFMNLATAGPVSEVSSKDMNSTLKKVLGPAAVAVAGFQQLFITGLSPIKNVRITYPNSVNVLHDDHSPDQVTNINGDLLVLAVGQARQMGRMINVCPEALLDDGLLDFTLAFGSAWKQVTALASGLVTGKEEEESDGNGASTAATAGPTGHDSSSSSHTREELKLLRLPWMIVEADEVIKCNRDGEPSPPSNRLVFEAIPRRINMHLPDTRLLLEGSQAAAKAAAAARQEEALIGARPASPAADAARGGKKQHRHHLHRPKIAKHLMDTGHSASPKLLKALWAAQQPPGRLSRMIPRLQKMISRTLMYAGMLAVGFALGYNAQNFVMLPGGASKVNGHPVHEEQQLMRV